MRKRSCLLTLACALALWAAPAAAQQRQVSGTVTAEGGEPLAAARVAITGTTQGVQPAPAAATRSASPPATCA